MPAPSASHRQIQDRHGRAWEVWEVVPTAVQRRAQVEPPPTQGDRRKLPEDIRVVVSEKLQKGWLAFQSMSEKRRLAPVPPGWSSLPEADLVTMLEVAEYVGKPKRLIE